MIVSMSNLTIMINCCFEKNRTILILVGKFLTIIISIIIIISYYFSLSHFFWSFKAGKGKINIQDHHNRTPLVLTNISFLFFVLCSTRIINSNWEPIFFCFIMDIYLFFFYSTWPLIKIK